MLQRYAATYDGGTVLFREGDDGHHMYVIQSGSVEICRQIGDHARTLAVLPAGEFFGEMAIINERPRSATAVVREASELLMIDRDTFEAMIRGKTEIAVRIIKTMASRLERSNQQVELLLLKDSNHRVVQCLRRLAEEHEPAGGGTIFIPVGPAEIADRVALPRAEVDEILERLTAAGLVVDARAQGLGDAGYLIPEVGRLLEFLEFLELKERFGRV